MGCDIHIVIEKCVDGTWQDVPWTSEDQRKYGPPEAVTDAFEMPSYFDGRNYNLFAILAGVRNGTWGRKLRPISEPKGFPDSDGSTEWDHYEGLWLGEHSFSYLTLKELQDYPWDDPYTYTAYVSKEVAEEMRKTGNPPSSWCAHGTDCVPVSWTTTIRHAVHEWPDDILPVLATLGKPEDVRIVFGFDS